MNLLFGKAGLSLLLMTFGAIGGMFLQSKVLTKKIEIPACPPCNCPEPTVSVQPFDVTKIKGLREFNYSPSYTGNVSIAGVDSAAIHKWIDNSVTMALKRNNGKK